MVVVVEEEVTSRAKAATTMMTASRGEGTQPSSNLTSLSPFSKQREMSFQNALG